MLKYLLDTDICLYVIKNRPEGLRARFNENADALAISAITAHELWFGVENSKAIARNRAVLGSFLARLHILPFDDKAAAHAGDIRADLKRKGTPIGAYDALIAGHARSQGLVMVTNNDREFGRVDGVRMENWV